MGRASATEQPGQRPGGHAPEVNELFSLDERQTILLAANMRQVQARSAADITVCQELGAACVTAQMYEETAALPLNGSVVLPDYFFRNLGVAWSQLIRLEPEEGSRAGAKQRATAAFLRYLRFGTISDGDRKAIEEGVLSLIPAPNHPRGAMETQQRQQPQQQQQPPQQQQPQQQPQQQ